MSAAHAWPEEGSPETPLLRVVRGAADDDEIAALVTAIAAAVAAPPSGAESVDVPIPPADWIATGRPAHGPRSWRSSGLPRPSRWS